MQSYTYLFINLACISIPLLASFYKKHAFYKAWKSFFKANIIVAILFIIWDSIFTKLGVWGFNSDYLTGMHLGNLPLEEILFFICIPFSCVFTFFALEFLLPKIASNKVESFISYFLIITLSIIAILNTEKLYTFITCISTSIFLIVLKIKRTNLSLHYISYFLILPFFFISNGILTGSLLVKQPIVWYNDAENLGIRISNIPVEDAIYGMLLIFMNIELYRYFKNRKTKALH